MSKAENNNPLKPISHEDFLNLRFPNGKFPTDFNHDNTPIHDIINTNNGNLGGVQVDNKYITKDVFEQFEKRIDDKLDSLPDRMADKMDAKISKFETRQTKWFVGVGIGLIGVLLKVFGII
ncbi:hypothetical protein [Staphylococcus cohnii]|uniref:hypothetical protein n=1 Tax=Staphylococcus cohnii TaxID=29382 RepID=UPI001F205847|nr:hypothetical protein [Staphylococcus cohnii]